MFTKIKPALWLGALLTALTLTLAAPAWAINPTPPWVIYDEGQEKPKPRWLALPYAFYSDTYDFAGGVAGGGQGYLQEQMIFFAAGLGSSNGTGAGYFYLVDVQAPWVPRLFFTVDFSAGYYTKQRAYAQGNPAYRGEQAGSNNSSKDDYLQGKGWQTWVDVLGKYVLPIGAGRTKPIQRYTLKKGLLVSEASGGQVWNPLDTGVSQLRLRFFQRAQSIDGDSGDYSFRTNGLGAGPDLRQPGLPRQPQRGQLSELHHQPRFRLVRQLRLLEQPGTGPAQVFFPGPGRLVQAAGAGF